MPFWPQATARTRSASILPRPPSSRPEQRPLERGLAVQFTVGDALDLDPLGLAGTIDTVIDSGVFHVFSDDDRPRYVDGPRLGAATGRHCLSDVLQ